MKKETVIDIVKQLADEYVGARDIDLYSLKVTGNPKKYLIQIVIDKLTGVTHDDCSELSKFVDSKLEAIEMFPEDFLLEVSSVGIERDLRNHTEYKRFTGSRVKVRFVEAGRKPLIGNIVSSDELKFTIKTGNETFSFNYLETKRVNIEVDWAKEFEKAE